MALMKPIVSTINAFDATNDQIIYFTSNGGDQVVKNEIYIINNDTSALVYNNTEETYQFNQTILANTLSNGIYYAVRFRVYNELDEVSDWSDYIPFYCYTTPILLLNILEGGIVNSSTFNAILSYDQAQEELINYGKIDLYNEDEILIKSSGILTNTSTPPLNVSYVFDGLLENITYKIKGTIITIENTVVETNLISFTVVYSQLQLYSTVKAMSYNCDGFVEINSNLISVDGLSNPSPPIYINNQQIDMGSCVNDFDNEIQSYWTKWNDGFSIPTNFILRYWFVPATINSEIIKLINNTNGLEISIKIVRDSNYDYAELTTTNGTILTSNGITHMNGTDNVLLWVKVVGSSWDITLETISRNTTVFEWNTSSNLKYNYTTDITYIGENSGNYIIPTQVENALSNTINDVKMGNSMAYHINITKNTNTPYSTSYPTWDIDTILDCNFVNNINGGNINLVISQIDGLRLRRKDENSPNWTTIYEKKVVIPSDLLLEYNDFFIPTSIEQTYAVVPILQGGIEGDYITTKITPNWNGVFISDGETNFKLYNSVVYDSTSQNVSIGVLNPIGAIYPIVLQNSINNYKSGGVQAQLLGYEFETTKTVNRNDVVKQVKDFMSFMTNGKSKVLIDWNGNSILFKIINSPSVSYNSNFGNGVVNVAFNWVEQGLYNNQNDLIENGFVSTI